MKRYLIIFISFFFFFSGCSNEDVVAVFKKPSTDIVNVMSIEQTKSEAMVAVSDVFQKVDEVGFVWSDSPNPSINNNILNAREVDGDQLLSFEIENLLAGKKYYGKAYCKVGIEVFYSEEFSWIQNFTGEWRRLKSPPLLLDEYIYNDNLRTGLSANTFECYKVDPFTNNAVYQIYYGDLGEWNPEFWGNRNQVLTPFPLRFNPIKAKFTDNSGMKLTLWGGGYNVRAKGQRFYSRAMFILESTGSWASYPGAEAPTVSFGIKKLAYVLENLPNGKLWTFDYSDLKWRNIGSFPYSKNAKYIGFEVGDRFFMMVEPAENQEKIKEFYEYLPDGNSWVRRADFLGENRRNGVAFMVDNRVFFGLGKTPDAGNALRDIWEYDIKNNSWRKNTDYPGAGTVNTAAMGLNGKAFVGFGMRVRKSNVGGEDFRSANDFWLFRPK